jgi:ankyrin repeat protein
MTWAAANGHEPVVKLLLEKGAISDNKDTKYGQTPLSCAASNGHELVVKLLLEKGAIANAQDHMKITALHAALYAGQNGVVGLLLTHGADPTIVDGYGRSSLD